MKLRQLIKEYVENYFNICDIKVISINAYNQYKQGMYWSTLEQFKNDEDIRIDDKFIDSYTDDLMDCIKDCDVENLDLSDRLERLYQDDDYFIILDEIVLNKLEK